MVDAGIQENKTELIAIQNQIFSPVDRQLKDNLAAAY